MFSFDMKFEDLENDENWMLSPPGQFSPNPLICLIPHQRHNIPGVEEDFDSTRYEMIL